MNTQISERDLVSMKLLHYFITKKQPGLMSGCFNLCDFPLLALFYIYVIIIMYEQNDN